jgi:SMC interacting uncharacterized protein involved in chromosome segregation
LLQKIVSLGTIGNKQQPGEINMARGIAGDIKREIVKLNKNIKEHVGFFDATFTENESIKYNEHLKAAAKSLREAAKLIK